MVLEIYAVESKFNQSTSGTGLCEPNLRTTEGDPDQRWHRKYTEREHATMILRSFNLAVRIRNSGRTVKRWCCKSSPEA